MQETQGINSKVLKGKEDYRYKQKEAELQLSLMNLILTVAIFLLAFAGNIVLTSLNVSLNTTIWAVVLLITVILIFVVMKKYLYYYNFILDAEKRILSEGDIEPTPPKETTNISSQTQENPPSKDYIKAQLNLLRMKMAGFLGGLLVLSNSILQTTEIELIYKMLLIAFVLTVSLLWLIKKYTKYSEKLNEI